MIFSEINRCYVDAFINADLSTNTEAGVADIRQKFIQCRQALRSACLLLNSPSPSTLLHDHEGLSFAAAKDDHRKISSQQTALTFNRTSYGIDHPDMKTVIKQPALLPSILNWQSND